MKLRGPEIECIRCSYQGQCVAKVTDLSRMACPTCGGKLKFTNPNVGDKEMAKARVKKMKAKQKAKAKKKAKKKVKAKKKGKKKVGGSRPIGRTSGVGVVATWVEAFEHNNKVSKAKQRSDKQISSHMKKEFPGRKSAIFDHVQLVRNRYNKGALTQGKIPKKKSARVED